MRLRARFRSEVFPFEVETIGARQTAIVDAGHGLVAAVPGQLDLVILDDVLLDDGVTAARTLQLGLALRAGVEVGSRNKSVVAWDVRCNLCCAHRVLMHQVLLLRGVSGKQITRVVALLAEGVSILTIKVAALGRVGFARQAPEGPSAADAIVFQISFHLVLVYALPVGA